PLRVGLRSHLVMKRPLSEVYCGAPTFFSALHPAASAFSSLSAAASFSSQSYVTSPYSVLPAAPAAAVAAAAAAAHQQTYTHLSPLSASIAPMLSSSAFPVMQFLDQ
ncbi:hypothetical protein FHG87_002302, partial [Trinorchestia longiramus]